MRRAAVRGTLALAALGLVATALHRHLGLAVPQLQPDRRRTCSGGTSAPSPGRWPRTRASPTQFVQANPGTTVDVVVMTPDEAHGKFDTAVQTAAAAPDVITVHGQLDPGLVGPRVHHPAGRHRGRRRRRGRVRRRCCRWRSTTAGSWPRCAARTGSRCCTTRSCSTGPGLTVPRTWTEVSAENSKLTALDVQTLYAPGHRQRAAAVDLRRGRHAGRPGGQDHRRQPAGRGGRAVQAGADAGHRGGRRRQRPVDVVVDAAQRGHHHGDAGGVPAGAGGDDPGRRRLAAAAGRRPGVPVPLVGGDRDRCRPATSRQRAGRPRPGTRSSPGRTTSRRRTPSSSSPSRRPRRPRWPSSSGCCRPGRPPTPPTRSKADPVLGAFLPVLKTGTPLPQVQIQPSMLLVLDDNFRAALVGRRVAADRDGHGGRRLAEGPQRRLHHRPRDQADGPRERCGEAAGPVRSPCTSSPPSTTDRPARSCR